VWFAQGGHEKPLILQVGAEVVDATVDVRQIDLALYSQTRRTLSGGDPKRRTQREQGISHEVLSRCF
jgi:hypothetical protein